MNIIPLTAFLICLNQSPQDSSLLFNGKNLDNWEILDYDGHGDVSVADSSIIIHKGEVISGIRWKGDFPKSNYEVTLYARRIEGNDFFCGLTSL